MSKRVAIEPNLSHLRDALQAQGYQVVPMDPGRQAHVDALVVSGMNDNLLGIADTNGQRAPVINAAGLTVHEVIREIERRALNGAEGGAGGGLPRG